MFLTKKGLFKILIMAICYFILGSIAIFVWAVFKSMGIQENFLLILGIIAYSLCVPLIFWGRYAEGKGKLINSGMQLVRKELKPADFIRQYETLKNTKELVINKPSIEALQLVALAYDLLDDKEAALATVDEMIDTAGDKKKTFAKLVKASFLFSYERKEEAERLFEAAQKQKLDFMSQSLADAILKSDRAMAMGDYKTVEAYNLQALQRSFPKLDNLGKLIVHFKLGEVYEKLQDGEKAVTYYRYCVAHGGETAITKTAGEKLQALQSHEECGA